MKISDHIKHSLDAFDNKDMNPAMLYACLAVEFIRDLLEGEISGEA